MKSFIKLLIIIFFSGLVSASIIIGYLEIQKNNNTYEMSNRKVSDISNNINVEKSYDKKQKMVQVKNSIESSAFAANNNFISEEQMVINVCKNFGPSVVNITSTTFQEDFFFNIVPTQGAGSGFVIDKKGYILTNFHVIKGAQKLDVSFSKQQYRYPAKLIGIHPEGDLSIIQVINVPPEILKPVKMGNSEKLQVGQKTIAIGNPFGLGQTVTTGVISSLNRQIKEENGKIISDLIQTDAAINQGNSGGPLLNSKGEVIGINTMIYTPTGGSVGIGFAIPINIAKRFIPDLIEKGEVRSPGFGAYVLPLGDYAEQIGLPVSEGLLILKTIPGGSADSAGLKGGSKQIRLGNYLIPINGDIIIEVDNIKVKTKEELLSYIESRKKVGDIIKVTIIRNKKKYNINVKLKEKIQ